MTAECLYTLQWDGPFSHQNCPFPWGNLDYHLIHGSLGLRPTQVLNPNGISSAVLHGSLEWQTDQPTDKPRYLVRKNRPHLPT